MTQPDTKSAEPFVPLPDEWADAPVCILGALGSCDDCCTRATDGDLCGPCTEKYEAIANVLRHFIRATKGESMSERNRPPHTKSAEEQAEQIFDNIERRMGLRVEPCDGSGKEQREAALKETVRILRTAKIDAWQEAARAVCVPCASGLIPDARGAHECTGISTSHQVWTTELKPCKAKAIHALIAKASVVDR